MLDVTAGITNLYTTQVVRPYIRASLSPNLWPGFEQVISSGSSAGGFTEQFNYGAAYFKNQFITAGRRSSFADVTRITTWPYSMGVSTSEVIFTGLTDITTGGKFFLSGETLNYFILNGHRDITRITTSGGTLWDGATTLFSGITGQVLDFSPTSDKSGYLAGGSFFLNEYSYNVSFVNFPGISQKVIKMQNKLDPTSLDPASVVDNTKCIVSFPNFHNTLLYIQSGQTGFNLYRAVVDEKNVYETEALLELGRNSHIEYMNLSIGESFVYVPFSIREIPVGFVNGITAAQVDSTKFWIYRQAIQPGAYIDEYSMIYTAGKSIAIDSANEYLYLWAGNTTQAGLTRFEFVTANTDTNISSMYFDKDILTDITQDVISYSNTNNEYIEIKVANNSFDLIYNGNSGILPAGISCLIFSGGTCLS